MGKTAKQRRLARRRVLRRFTQWMEAETASPCDTCAFRDPEAFVADPEIPRKLRRCLANGEVFWCHHGLDDNDGRYLVPNRDGRPDTAGMSICAGFVRLYQVLRDKTPERQHETLRQLQRTMVARWLASDAPEAKRFEEICKGDPQAMVEALELLADSHERARAHA